MFLNRFIGGPLDGEVRGGAPDTMTAERLVDRMTGAVYARAPDLDTDDAWAWVPDPDPPGQQRHVRSDDRRGITLGELRRFVAVADREGWPDDVRPKALAGFRARLLRIELGHSRR